MFSGGIKKTSGMNGLGLSVNFKCLCAVEVLELFKLS